MSSEKLALTPYDLAVMTAVAQGLQSGTHRAQHPERAGEPALERGIGQGLTSTLGHLGAALPAAYLTRGMGGLASGALATLAGIGGGMALPAVADRVGQIGHDALGGRVGSRGDTGGYGVDAMQPMPTSMSMSATAQPEGGSESSRTTGGMGGSMGAQSPKTKKIKEPTVDSAKHEKKETKKEEAAEEKTAEDGTFMNSFMKRWRKLADGDMRAKIALFKSSGFNAQMKKSQA